MIQYYHSKGGNMNRAVKLKLKNGKIITIRRTRGPDYDAVMKFMEKFTHDVGAIQTMQYAGQPKKDKEMSMRLYESNDHLFLGAWDGNNIIGTCSISKMRPNHPYCMGTSAGVGMSILSKYTHNGIGTKMFQIMEKWARKNGVRRIEGERRHVNIPSIGNCIKNGFLIVGLKRDAAIINGKYIHHYVVEKVLE